jgi:hypothetical protein
MVWTRFWPRIRSSVGLLWIGNEQLNATESKEFLDWLSDLASHEGLCGWDKQDGLCQPSDLLINLKQTMSGYQHSEVNEFQGLLYYI